MEGEKITKQVNFSIVGGKTTCTGYEIHNGRTEILSRIQPLNKMENGFTDGCFTENCYGTYIHGILDNAEFVDMIIAPFLVEKAQQPSFDYFKFKEEQFDKLADHVRKHVDMELVYKIMHNS